MNFPPPFGNFFPQQQGGPQQQQQQQLHLQQQQGSNGQQQQQQGQGAGIGQQQPQQQQQPSIDPALLQSLYPQAFQALALQQQLAAMGKGIAAHQLQQQQQAAAAAQQQQQHQQHHHQQQGGLPPQLQLPPLPLQLPMQLQQHPNAFFQQVLASFPGGQDSSLLAQITQQQMMQHQHAQHMAAMQQQQQQQQLQHQHQRDKGADMYDDDYEDDDEEYEDDDAPRKRRKPKKVPTGPAAPKPPKGAPRQYVVCKDCPQCKLKVGNNTRVCRGCGHVFTNVKQHSSHQQHLQQFSGPPTNPDGSAMESRRSTRKKAKYTPSNAVDYMDKDEQAQLQIALANSLVEVKTGDLSQVKDAPEYHPTVAEWKNPIGYIEKIRAEAETFGIAKIVPPAGKWNPPFKLKPDFKFPTRLQHLHKLTEAVGFEPGKSYTPVEYEAMANAFRERWIAERNAKTGAVGQPSEEELEQAYWKIVETAQPPTEIEYGNDVSNVVAGGGAFESVSAEIDPAAYAGEPSWNLNLLPHAAGSVLKSLPQSIQGITEPWLYMGMLFATFCWHTEDDYLYSMNYLHKGAPKIWYSVPARKSQAFEKVLQRTLAQLIYEEPDLHLKLVTMLPPALLHSHQVPVFRTVQQAGTFIVTFPRAQHAGMSLGYNIAEAVNFASDSWFQYGREAMGRYKKYARGSVLSYAQLLFDCILNSRWKYNVDILRDELLNLYETELRGRRLCRDYGVVKKQRINAQTFETGQELECAKCRIPLYLSFVGCPCILDHAHLIAPPRTRIPDDPLPQQQQQQQQQQQLQQQQQQLLQHDDHHQLHDEGGPAHHGLHSHHDSSLFNPNDPHSHEHHMQQLQQHDGQHNMQPHPVAAAAAAAPEPQEPPPPPPEPRYSSLCLCECMHQIWCLDHIRQAKAALDTDHGGQMPVLFYRHVLPELVAMDEILAQPASEDELKGKVNASQILKDRTATLELDKDELPPTPPPPAAQEFESLDADAAAAAAAAAPVVVKPKPKKERSRPVRHASDDDEEFEPDRNADLDDEDSDDDNPPIHGARNNHHHQMHTGMPSAFPNAHLMYPGMPPAMYSHMAQAAALAQQQQAAAAAPQPRSQPRRTARDAGREDLKDGAYVNLDLVELDPVPGMDDDEEEETRKRAAADINPQVRQALSAIVEAIAEVSSMKVNDDGPQGMELEAAAAAANAMPAVAAAAAAAQQQQQQQLMAAQAAAMQVQAAQMGLSPAQLMQQMQQAQFLQHQEVLRQQQLRMQAGQR